MSLLQIKQLRAPEEINKGSINTTGTQTTTTTTDTSYNVTDQGVFTCYFARTVETADYAQPSEAGGVASIEIAINIYDSRGKPISTTSLQATQAVIKNNDHICFKLAMSDTDFQQLAGSSIYVFASISTSKVSFKENYLGNWHDTIKQVFIYDTESIENVYWSSQPAITDTNDLTKKDAEIEKIEKINTDAHIHIKVKGICGKVVKLSIYEDGQTDSIAEIDANVYKNRKVVTLSAKYLIACYCSKSGVVFNEKDDIDLKFKVKVVYNYTDKEGKAAKLEKESEKLQLTCKMETIDALATNGNVYVEVGGSETAVVGPERYTDFHIGYICHIEGIGKMVNKNDNTQTNSPKATVYPFHTYKIELSDLVKSGLITVEDAIHISVLFSADTTKFHKDNATLSNGKSLIDEIFIDKSSYKKGTSTLKIAKKEAVRKVLTQVDKSEVFNGKTGLLSICRDAWQVPTDYKEDTSIAEKDRHKETTTKVTTTIAKDGDNLKQTVKTEITTVEGKDTSATTTTTTEPDVETILSTKEEKKGKKEGTTTKTTVVKVTQQTPEENRSARYGSNNECPFGSYFLNFVKGKKYDSKVAWKALKDQNIGVYDANSTNGIPASPNRINREAIALHRGGPTASQGCLTFNVGYNDSKATSRKGRYLDFDEEIFANEYYLNFLCIDERNAANATNATVDVNKRTQTKTDNKDPVNTKKSDKVTLNDKRYYDLIDPNGNKK